MLDKMHTRSGSNGATEPVLISPLPATMAALVAVKLCPRPAGSAIFDLHASSVTHTYALRTDYPCFLPRCLSPTQTLGDLLRESFTSQDEPLA